MKARTGMGDLGMGLERCQSYSRNLIPRLAENACLIKVIVSSSRKDLDKIPVLVQNQAQNYEFMD